MAPRADDAPGSLAAIGLTSDEEAIYRALVDGSPITADGFSGDELTANPGYDVTAVLTRLVASGLVATTGDPPQYTAVAPDVGLEVILLARERDLRNAQRRIGELSDSYRAHLAGPGISVVELVTGTRAVAQRAAQIRQAARYELRILDRRAAGSEAEAAGDPQIRCRVLYEQNGIDRRHTAAIGAPSAGHQIRVVAEVPVSLVIADDRLALLELQREPQSAAAEAVIVHPSGLLDALGSLFESLWRRGRPIGADPADVDRDRLVEMMKAGYTDQAMSRQLGIGHRTVQRRIAALLDESGARTRFQAGVQAALRDLHPPTGDR
ncbi:hypothetical protein [Nakamurella lactea]|uniref:hypothetical protein n=1 Tax=Nakamurella lactea TaxID=459515 RepID=UPI000426FC05|nr:hypothetical protein [Nakamurella lactea]